MKKTQTLIALIAALPLFACATPGQNLYATNEVGKSVVVEFGTIVGKRNVDVKNTDNTTGALAGGALGAAGGANLGGGNGSAVGAVGGAIAGAVIGGLAQQAMSHKVGIEYVITKENGKTLSLVQVLQDNDQPINIGDRVMVQTSGSFQRVLPAAQLPTEIKRPKGIKVVD